MPRRRLGYLVFCAALLVLAAPLVLYALGLRGVHGVPAKPQILATPEQQVLAWKLARGKGVPHIDASSPYSITLGLLSGKSTRDDAGLVVAWWVARDYLFAHRRHQGMSWWHLSGAALTIWLSRNWSTEELLTKGFELSQPSRLKNPPVPDADTTHAR
jgi:hypothetical protein